MKELQETIDKLKKKNEFLAVLMHKNNNSSRYLGYMNEILTNREALDCLNKALKLLIDMQVKD